jgi:penicillin-binding protein 1A
MQTALKGVPVAQLTPPAGVTRVGDDWYYDEYAHGGGVTHLGGSDLDADDPDNPNAAASAAPGSAPPAATAPATPPPSSERSRILDMFR